MPQTYMIDVLFDMKKQHERDVSNAISAAKSFYLELQKIFSKYDFDTIIAEQALIT